MLCDRAERRNYFVDTGLRHGPSAGSVSGEIKQRNTHVDANVKLVRTGVRIPPPPPYFVRIICISIAVAMYWDQIGTNSGL